MTLSEAMAVSMLAAALSTICYVGLLISFDRHEREPWSLMLFAFGWGAAPAVLLSLFAEQYVGASLNYFLDTDRLQLVFTAVVAPIIEELAKAVPLVIVFWFHRHEFDGLLDGLLYGSLTGFGFAMTENVFYFVNFFHHDPGMGWQLVFFRSLVFGLNHALYCSCLGLGLAVARLARRPLVRWLAPMLGLATGIALHMFHNYSVMTHETWTPALISNWGGVAVWLVLVAAALAQEATWIREELRDEVALGLISERDWRTVTRNRRRVTTKLAAIRQARADQLNHYYSLLAELAFKKRHYKIHPEDMATLRRMEQLRSEVREIRSQGWV